MNGVADSWQIESSNINSNEGRLTVTASGSDPLTGETFASVDATVPKSATTGESGIIGFENVQYQDGNDQSISGSSDAALQRVAFFGDSNGSGDYSGLDASLIARTVVGLDSGFDAYPMTDPAIIGDTNGNGELSGLDASFVTRQVVGLSQPEIPDLPA